MKAAILTLSDKGARGEREDRSGPALETWLAERGVTVLHSEIVPDDLDIIYVKLEGWADSGAFNLILTTGGTGVSPRDVTPDVTRKIVEREIPGFGEVMRRTSMEKTPHAMISRSVAGIRKQTLIVNLPGSPRAVRENLAVILPALTHAIEKIKGDPSDCGSPSS